MKVDYKTHIVEYIELLNKKPDLTVKQYCEKVGINYQTARRHIKKPKSEKTKEAPKEKPIKKIKMNASKSQVLIQSKPNAKGFDWHSLLREFLARATKNPALTMAEFADEKKILRASLRRTFKKMRNLAEFRDLWDLYDAQFAQFSPLKPKKNNKPQKDKPRINKALSHAEQKQDQTHNPSEKNKLLGNGGKGSLAKNAQIAQKIASIGRPVTHGLYSKSRDINRDIMLSIMQIDPLSVNEELILARKHLYRMDKRLDEKIALIDEQEEQGTLPLDSEGKPVDPERLRDRAIFGYVEAFASFSAVITNMTKNEQKRYELLCKLEFEEMKLGKVLALEEANLVMEVLRLRATHGWTAIKTCQEIELLGAKPPVTLFHEAKIELSSLEPEIDDTGISPKELNALFDEYQDEQLKYDDAWLEHRKKLVHDAMEEAEEKDEQFAEITADEIKKEARKASEYDELEDRERKQSSVFDDFNNFEVL